MAEVNLDLGPMADRPSLHRRMDGDSVLMADRPSLHRRMDCDSVLMADRLGEAQPPTASTGLAATKGPRGLWAQWAGGAVNGRASVPI